MDVIEIKKMLDTLWPNGIPTTAYPVLAGAIAAIREASARGTSKNAPVQPTQEPPGSIPVATPTASIDQQITFASESTNRKVGKALLAKIYWYLHGVRPSTITQAGVATKFNISSRASLRAMNALLKQGLIKRFDRSDSTSPYFYKVP